jgi:hypothetical protein
MIDADSPGAEFRFDPRKETRRVDRGRVLVVLARVTGSFGDEAAAPRVRAYIKDPVHASNEDFGYVGALQLRRFYAWADKPEKADRLILWTALMFEFAQPGLADPGHWGASTTVSQLQRLVDEAIDKGV